MHLVVALNCGGMEHQILNISSMLPSAEFSTSICAMQPNGVLEARAESLGIPVFHVLRRFGNDPQVPWQLARLLKRQRIDILHSHNWGTLLEAYGAVVLNRRTRLVHGEHGRLETETRRVVAQRFVWQRARQLLSVSNDLADRMSKRVGIPRGSIRVVPNGVDVDRYVPLPEKKSELREELEIPRTRFTLGMLARFVEFKDHAGVIDAVARLVERGLDIQLVLIGGGPLEANLRSKVEKLSLADRVFFLGIRQRVSQLLPAIDVVISNSSSCEGMSNAVLEAMACGVPVIGTTTAANPELLAGGTVGRLIEPQDQSALCRAIEELYQDRGLLDELSRMSRRRVVDHYPLPSMVNSYGQVYAELCDRQPTVQLP